jgi:hypothetical protein
VRVREEKKESKNTVLGMLQSNEDHKSKNKKMSKMTKDNRELFLKERDRLIENSNAQSDAFDKYLLSLAAGTFTLTITFYKNLFTSLVCESILLLIVAWALMTLTILLTLFSLWVSRQAHNKQIEIVQKYYEDTSKELKSNAWGLWIGRLTIAAGISFTLGLILIFLFVLINLK